MIKIENTEVVGWEAAIRGMRNPMNSWAKSDSIKCKSGECDICMDFYECPFGRDPRHLLIGDNDLALMKKLAAGGPVHAKYRRMITVYVDITAPLYWWKEFDTYKVGTVANSCSTMHKIHEKEFTMGDFSTEHLLRCSRTYLKTTIDYLNFIRDIYLNGGMVDNHDGTAAVFEPKTKEIWWQMIQLLPTSYNQKRTIMLNYEVLAGIYPMRKNHKLDEWRDFCKWIEELPYSEIIIGEKECKSS